MARAEAQSLFRLGFRMRKERRQPCSLWRVEGDEVKKWFHPACAAVNIQQPGKMRDAFEKMLETEERLIIEVILEKWITFDAAKMMRESIRAWKEMGLLA